MKIKPHDLFEIFRGDEVAECWPGDQQFGETPEVGVAALVHYWHLLSESDQERLNTMAEKYQKKEDERHALLFA